jgi:hypothetical protein
MAHSCGQKYAQIVAKSADCVKGGANVARQGKPFTDNPVYQDVAGISCHRELIWPNIHPNMSDVPRVSEGVKGFAVASAVPVAVSLLRLPIDAYYSGKGMINAVRYLNPVGILFGLLLPFVALLVVAFPIWLVFRYLKISKLWPFAITGVAFGIALTSRIKLEVYKNMDSYHAWYRGQETLRPVLDALSYFLYGFLPFIVFWLVVYHFRPKEA